MDLLNEYFELVDGQNYGSGFWLGTDRIHGEVGTFREMGTGKVFHYPIRD